jgi:hypothetical protein
MVDRIEPDDTNHDEIDRNNVIQQTRHDENQNASDESDEGLNVGNSDCHDELSFACPDPRGSQEASVNRRFHAPPRTATQQRCGWNWFQAADKVKLK